MDSLPEQSTPLSTYSTVSPRSWYLYSLHSLAFWPFNPQRHKMVNTFKQFVGISRRIVSGCPFCRGRLLKGYKMTRHANHNLVWSASTTHSTQSSVLQLGNQKRKGEVDAIWSVWQKFWSTKNVQEPNSRNPAYIENQFRKYIMKRLTSYRYLIKKNKWSEAATRGVLKKLVFFFCKKKKI